MWLATQLAVGQFRSDIVGGSLACLLLVLGLFWIMPAAYYQHRNLRLLERWVPRSPHSRPSGQQRRFALRHSFTALCIIIITGSFWVSLPAAVSPWALTVGLLALFLMLRCALEITARWAVRPAREGMHSTALARTMLPWSCFVREHWIARIYAEAGEVESALSVLSDAVWDDPTRTAQLDAECVLNELVRIRFLQGKLDSVAEVCDAALSINPTNPTAYRFKAELDLRSGRSDDQTLALLERACIHASRQLLPSRAELALAGADQAWAMAILGRETDVATYRESAARLCDDLHSGETDPVMQRLRCAAEMLEDEDLSDGSDLPNACSLGFKMVDGRPPIVDDMGRAEAAAMAEIVGD